VNESKFLQDGFARSSEMLHQALELCSTRDSLAIVLGEEGIIDSRWAPTEEWTKSAGGIVFRLRPAGELRKFGERHYFHRLEVACPVCGRWVPAGRLHQHARVHVRKRLDWRSPVKFDRPSSSVYWRYWYVDAVGYWKPQPREFQRGFPSMPAGF
jgi:hypothetical protein